MLELALDQRRYQCLDQRNTGTAQQRRGHQGFALVSKQTPQAGRHNHAQAQGHAIALAQTGLQAQPEQGHQAHANHRQAGQPGAGLKAHAGVGTDLQQQRADRTEQRAQVKPKHNQQGPMGNNP